MDCQSRLRLNGPFHYARPELGSHKNIWLPLKFTAPLFSPACKRLDFYRRESFLLRPTTSERKRMFRGVFYRSP